MLVMTPRLDLVNVPGSEWVTITQAARMLGLRPKAVRKLLDAGRLPHAIHGAGARLVRRHEVQALADRTALPLHALVGA